MIILKDNSIYVEISIKRIIHDRTAVMRYG